MVVATYARDINKREEAERNNIGDILMKDHKNDFDSTISFHPSDKNSCGESMVIVSTSSSVIAYDVASRVRLLERSVLDTANSRLPDDEPFDLFPYDEPLQISDRN